MGIAAKARTDEASAPEVAGAIDHEHLRRYTLGDARLELEILWLLIDQAPSTVGALKQARTDKEWVTAAHTLKGSARAVGAWRLAKLAEQAERLGGPREGGVCDLLLGQLDEAAAEARAHIVALGPPA
jgi:HPt (histidine-containing phosphotransfer) domain-containing protein